MHGFSEDITTVKELIKQLLRNLGSIVAPVAIASAQIPEWNTCFLAELRAGGIASISVKQEIEIDLHQFPNCRDVLDRKCFVCSEPAAHKSMRANPAEPIGQTLRVDAVQFSAGAASPQRSVF